MRPTLRASWALASTPSRVLDWVVSFSTTSPMQRSGARKHEVMGVIAKSLGDADIQAAAVYFSSFEIQLKSR